MALTKTQNKNDQPYPRDVALLEKKVAELQTAVEALTALANELKADYNAHTHDGITAGSASSGTTSASTTAADVTL